MAEFDRRDAIKKDLEDELFKDLEKQPSEAALKYVSYLKLLSETSPFMLAAHYVYFIGWLLFGGKHCVDDLTRETVRVPTGQLSFAPCPINLFNFAFALDKYNIEDYLRTKRVSESFEKECWSRNKIISRSWYLHGLIEIFWKAFKNIFESQFEIDSFESEMIKTAQFINELQAAALESKKGTELFSMRRDFNKGYDPKKTNKMDWQGL